MLSSARNHRQSNLSQKLYDRMKSLFPGQKPALISASILLSNTYSAIGEHELAQQVRRHRLQQFGSKIEPEVSWTNVNGEFVVRYAVEHPQLEEMVAFYLQEFQAHDRSHPRSAEIYAEVERQST